MDNGLAASVEEVKTSQNLTTPTSNDLHLYCLQTPHVAAWRGIEEVMKLVGMIMCWYLMSIVHVYACVCDIYMCVCMCVCVCVCVSLSLSFTVSYTRYIQLQTACQPDT